MKYVLILTLVLCMPLTAMADCSTNWMQCSADSPIQISSFEMHAKDVISKIILKRQVATEKLTKHEITAATAKSVLAKTDAARGLWNQARSVCHETDAGNCRGDELQAFALLAQAQKAIR